MNLIFLFISIIEVYFSPKGGCKEAIIREIKNAEKTIYIAMYVLSEDEIIEELINAKKRKVDVKILLDWEGVEGGYTREMKMRKAGIDIRIAKRKENANMHNKFAVIDGKVVITGSYNWTRNAEELNDENLLIIKDEPEIAKKFQEYFLKKFKEGSVSDVIGKYVNGNDKKEVKKYVGKYAYVVGKVYKYNISKGGNLFIDFGKTKESFTFVMWKEGVNKLKERGFDFTKLKNSKVRVYGKIIDHPKYGLEITTDDPDALVILE